MPKIDWTQAPAVSTSPKPAAKPSVKPAAKPAHKPAAKLPVPPALAAENAQLRADNAALKQQLAVLKYAARQVALHVLEKEHQTKPVMSASAISDAHSLMDLVET